MRVLLVDDDPRVVEALERVLEAEIDDIDLSTATSGREALDVLEGEPFDLLVTDMRMPQMDGAELLERVHERWPDVVRFVLSGQMDRAAAIRSLPHAHQFLSKPCPVGKMVAAVERARTLRGLITDPVVRSLVGSVGVLPTSSPLLREVTRLLAEPEVSPTAISAVLRQDPVLAAKTLQLANSTCFADGPPTTDLGTAVARLGVETLSGLMLSTGLARAAEGHLSDGFDLVSFERRSVLRGVWCRLVGETEREPFVAGLLSHLGVLVLAIVQPAVAAAIQRRVDAGERRVDVEREILGTSYAQLGGYLLGLWGLPAHIVDAVAFHHDLLHVPEEDRELTAMVHVVASLTDDVPLDEAGLEAIGLRGEAHRWVEAAQATGERVG